MSWIEDNNEDEPWIDRHSEPHNLKDMTTEYIKNIIKAIEEDRIIFSINLGYFEDNDFEVIEEATDKKEYWLNRFKNELKRRENMINQITELKNIVSLDGTYEQQPNTEQIINKINEVIKTINDIIDKLNK